MEPGVPAGRDRPNLMLILADDMGYSDLGCYGSEIRTPHLDSLARHGVRFSQMYNCARCCPTRASLLTGLYPHQAGVGHMIADHGVGPAYQGYLRTDCVTIAEVLQAHGYRTAYAGKWHVSAGLPLVGEPAVAPGGERNPAPFSRGFERFYGTLAGAGSYFYPHGLMRQDQRITPDPEGYYYTDAISDEACRMIDEAGQDNRPFFLHVCYTAPHWPLQARPEDIEPYRHHYRKGWDHFRTARHEKLKGQGLVSSHGEISPRDPDSRDFFGDSAPRQEWESLRMAVYAAQVTSMDRGIGRILAQLRASGIEENTIVMFLSDNGGCAEFLKEDGEDTKWPGMYRHTARPGESCTVGNIEGQAPGPATTFMSYDLPWANLSNAPFRLYKHWVHEGGIATPLVVQWPAGAEPGKVVHSPAHVIDLMATCLDAASARYPASHRGVRIQPLEGASLLPLIRGQSVSPDRLLFWEHEGNSAVRAGEWKLVRRHPGGWELYNMEKDRTEVHSLAGREKPRVDQLAQQYQDWAARCGVLDWPPRRRH